MHVCCKYVTFEFHIMYNDLVVLHLYVCIHECFTCICCFDQVLRNHLWRPHSRRRYLRALAVLTILCLSTVYRVLTLYTLNTYLYHVYCNFGAGLTVSSGSLTFYVLLHMRVSVPIDRCRRRHPPRWRRATC